MKTTRILAISVLVLGVGLPAGVANADFTFGEATNLGPAVNTSYNDLGPCISADGLSLYFHSTRPDGYGGGDIWVATRDTKDADWGNPMNLGSTVNSSQIDAIPSISADGLTLFFVSDRWGGFGEFDLYMTMRATINNDWGIPVNLGPTVNSSTSDSSPSISADGLSLYFSSMRPGGSGIHDIYVMTRATKEDNWGTPVNLGPTVNSSGHDSTSSISADGLSLFFYSDRPGGVGGRDLWVTTRPNVDEPWGPPLNPGAPLNTANGEWFPSISPDGLSLYFCDHQVPRPGGVGGEDIWQAPILPVVDFNADGIVDAADMCIMVDHWGEDYSLCDIGPMPWGDGVVDTQDLIVLSEYFFEELNDPTLAAHWAFNETEGMAVADSAGDNNGYALGEPIWQPDAGMVDGSLQLDGVDDYVITGAALNPAEGPFSLLVWINGGAPGQIVMSQQGAANWLMADTGGNLMTELKSSTQDATELPSQAIITDGEWHRIGLVWDGLYRKLYVDGIVVAEDTQDSIEGSDSGLYIGCGKGMETGTFFSGLIDDVRIYNRVVIP